MKSRIAKPNSSAFTLIELTIAISMMLVLMLGVQYIFSSVGSAVGTTQTMSKVLRDAQATQAIMSQDFGGVAGKDAPFFIIESQVKAAFRNRADQLSDGDFNTLAPNSLNIRSQDLNANGVETDPGETTPNAIYDHRNHRQDRISFFSRGIFRRQTGNDGIYVSDMTAPEAFISYGHLKLYDGVPSHSIIASASYPQPGDYDTPATPNPFNQYASQWILGRTAILLVEPTGTVIKDQSGDPQVYYDIGGALSPLGSGTDDSGGLAEKWPSTSSRLDLAGTSINAERLAISGFCAGSNNDWWTRFSHPFWATTYIDRTGPGLQSKTAARLVPILMTGCSHFMVEFAGDYLKQNVSTGAVEDVHSYVKADGSSYSGVTDSETDFVLVGGERKIRWYGMPRDVDGKIVGGQLTVDIDDVVPLRDVIRTRFADVHHAPMERGALPAYAADYALSMSGSAKYLCAWGPGNSYGGLPVGGPFTSFVPAPPLPQLIRITFVLDDPNGRIGDGQTFEYVFKVQ